MKATAQMGGLTRQQIEDWRSWAREGHTMEFGKILNAQFIALCDLALQGLGQGWIRTQEAPRQVAWIDGEAKYVGLLIDATQYLFKLPPPPERP